MSLPTQRRDPRRRLLVSWSRSGASGTATAAPAPRPMAEYAAQAHPDRQPGPATLIPTGIGGLALASTGILLPMAAAIAVGGWEAASGRPLLASGGRFATSLQLLAACFDPRGAASLQGWMAQLFLFGAAVVALVVRLMRFHRRDDYKGRYRAWGWLAGLLVVTALAGTVPLGRLVGAAMAEATGVVLGPGGIGWWFALAAAAWTAVAPWAVLPLHRRLGTAVWLGMALAAWATAAACAWMGLDRGLPGVAGRAAWSLAAALAAVAMLTAARSVIREVRGLAVGKPSRAVAPPRGDAEPVSRGPVARRDEEDVDERFAVTDEANADEEGLATAYVDGSEQEQEQRHLSKAERKRLKKLARMQRASA
jgi:hypothetical protein